MCSALPRQQTAGINHPAMLTTPTSPPYSNSCNSDHLPLFLMAAHRAVQKQQLQDCFEQTQWELCAQQAAQSTQEYTSTVLLTGATI